MNDTGYHTRPNRGRLAQITDESDGIHLLHVRTGLHVLRRTICSGVAGPTVVGSNIWLRNGKIGSLFRKMCDLCSNQPPTQDDKNRVT